MKTKKSKSLVILITFICIIVMLTSCVSDEEITSVMEAIDAIGEVTLQSSDSIQTAERLYQDLDEKKQSSVSNYNNLEQARLSYNSLLEEERMRLEQERLEQERIAAELAEQERLEKERLEKERLEQEQLRQKQEVQYKTKLEELIKDLSDHFTLVYVLALTIEQSITKVIDYASVRNNNNYSESVVINMFFDNDIHITTCKELQTSCLDQIFPRLEELSNPPDKYEEAYIIINNMYDSFNQLFNIITTKPSTRYSYLNDLLETLNIFSDYEDMINDLLSD